MFHGIALSYLVSKQSTFLMMHGTGLVGILTQRLTCTLPFRMRRRRWMHWCSSHTPAAVPSWS